MDNVNFRGGFLIKKPSTRMWNNIQTVLPRRKCVFQNYNEEGDKFFAIKDYYDVFMADYILSRKINFEYYPNINLKSRLDTYFPVESKKIIESQNEVIKTKKELRKYIKTHRIKDSLKAEKYQWKENDHIAQTLKALNISQQECRADVKNGITTIYDMKGAKIAVASPNGVKGVNFVYEYPRRENQNSRRLAVDKDGKVIWEYSIADITDFQKYFLRNVKIDKSRKRPMLPLK